MASDLVDTATSSSPSDELASVTSSSSSDSASTSSVDSRVASTLPIEVIDLELAALHHDSYLEDILDEHAYRLPCDLPDPLDPTTDDYCHDLVSLTDTTCSSSSSVSSSSSSAPLASPSLSPARLPASLQSLLPVPSMIANIHSVSVASPPPVHTDAPNASSEDILLAHVAANASPMVRAFYGFETKRHELNESVLGTYRTIARLASPDLHLSRRGHLDGGAQASTTHRKDLLWDYVDLSPTNPYLLHVADSHPHQPKGRGFLRVPVASKSGDPSAPIQYLSVECFYTPTMPTTIISPTAMSKAEQCAGYSSLLLHDDDRGHIVLQGCRRSRRIEIPAANIGGLLYTGELWSVKDAHAPQFPPSAVPGHVDPTSVDESLRQRRVSFAEERRIKKVFAVNGSSPLDECRRTSPAIAPVLPASATSDPLFFAPSACSLSVSACQCSKRGTAPLRPPTARDRLLWLARTGFQSDITSPDSAPPPSVDSVSPALDQRDQLPADTEFFDYVVNALSTDDLRRLWHLRFGHTNFRRVSDMHHYADGVPKVSVGTFLDSCPVCQQEKLTKAARQAQSSRRATACNQGLSVDFGFIVQRSSTNSARLRQFAGYNGETCYCLITDHFSGRLYGECFASKAPPIDFLNRWLARHGLPKDTPDKYVRLDLGGDLGLSADVCDLFSNAGYTVETIPPNASASNGPGERPHRTIGDALRAMLAGAQLPPKFWPYAFHHYLRLYNVTVHGSASASPITICTGKKPDLSLLRVFGCRVYALPSRPHRPAKLQHDARPGIFLGYSRTMRDALYFDSTTKHVLDTQHIAFDEAMNDLADADKPPNARLLSRSSDGKLPSVLADTFRLPVSVPDLEVQTGPFCEIVDLDLPFDPSHAQPLGVEYRKCDRFLRAYLSDVHVSPPGFRSLRAFKKRYLGAYIIRVGDVPVFSPDQVDKALADLASSSSPPDTVTLSFAPERFVPTRSALDPPLHLRISDLRRICSLHHVPAHDGLSNSALRQELDNADIGISASTLHDLMQHVRDGPFDTTSDEEFHVHRLQNEYLTDEEAKLPSFTRRNLKKLSNWADWDAAHDKQLDAHHDSHVFAPPIPRSDLTKLKERFHVLRFQWSNLVKPSTGVRKARCCLDGSKRAAPWLRTFAKTYASCISQPCMRLFLALAAVNGLQVTIGDVVNAFQSLNPPPTDLCYVEVDEAYIDWYERKTGIRLALGKFVVPVLRTLQGHPEAGALYEKEITKILVGELGFQPTTQEPNLLRGTIDGDLVLICRQVDDFAFATKDPATAEKLIARLNKFVTVESDGVGSKFNGIEIEQTRAYLRLHCESYIDRVLQSHGWEQPGARESDRHDSVPMRPEESARLQALTGPIEGSAEHKALATEMKFGYRQLLGELLYAYLVCRLDIGYAVSTLSRFSTHPHREHYIALRKICLYLRRTKSFGLVYWRPSDKQVPTLPVGSFVPVSVESDFADFPSVPLDALVGYVDAAYGTDLSTRKSVTGIVLCFAGAAVAFKSKLQATVSTSSTEAEFIAAVDAAKQTKYLRSVLSELGFAPPGPTVLHEDNQAAIEMINHEKPTARSRHVDIQHFAIQEWRRRGIIDMKYISTHLNLSDAATKALSWILLSRHTRRAMGHYGPC